ncbi:MAG TPA: hypothetical protein VHR45_10145 [Thermoanaerobaculia bacterium]|nr:hypothetical protein [Thermoanaerobaculia bacterium]
MLDSWFYRHSGWTSVGGQLGRSAIVEGTAALLLSTVSSLGVAAAGGD